LSEAGQQCGWGDPWAQGPVGLKPPALGEWWEDTMDSTPSPSSPHFLGPAQPALSNGTGQKFY